MISKKDMGLFDDMLGSDESIFLDPVALDYDYLPKLIPYREKEQHHVALCIKPLFSERNGKNLILHGPPGVGKTAAIRHIFRELEETTDDVVPIYINVWQKNTTYKVVIDICDQLNYKFTHNKKTDELFKIIETQLNKTGVVFCFDEIDKAEDLDFLYTILEKIYRKTIILITNYKEWMQQLDERIKSRLTLEALEFKKYDSNEIKGILMNRLKYAFVPGVWDNSALDNAVKKTTEIGDVRTGLYILREAGNNAENRASKKIETVDVEEAIKKISEIKVKKTSSLNDEENMILELIRENSGKKIGDLFEIYKEKGGQGVYKTFQRKIGFLSKNQYISTTKVISNEGNTTIVRYEKVKTLDEF